MGDGPFVGLAPQQKKFVALVLDGVSPKDAAVRVGYQNGRVGAWNLAQNPKVRDALHNGFVARLATEAVPRALATFINCLDAPKEADRIKAADCIIKYYKDFAPNGVEGVEGLTLAELEHLRATLEAQLRDVTPGAAQTNEAPAAAPILIEHDSGLFA